jgi:hypothetical protein
MRAFHPLFMKRSLIALLGILIFTFGAWNVFAEDEIAGPQPQVEAGDQYFTEDEDLVIDETVNGDLFIVGKNVEINGEVLGDVFIVADTLTLRGKIQEDLFMVGDVLELEGGQIGDSVRVFAGTVNADAGSFVAGGLTFFSGEARLSGRIAESVHGYSTALRLAGPIGGQVRVNSGALELEKGARLERNLKYKSAKEALIDEEALVIGGVTHVPKEKKGLADVFTWDLLMMKLGWLALGLLLLHFFPKMTQGLKASLMDHPWKSMFTGFSFVILVPFLAVFLMISILGFPAGMILSFIYFGMWFLTPVLAAWVTGLTLESFFGARKFRPAVLFTMGYLISQAIFFIPVAGIFISLAVKILGMGVFLLSVMSLRKTNHKE